MRSFYDGNKRTAKKPGAIKPGTSILRTRSTNVYDGCDEAGSTAVMLPNNYSCTKPVRPYKTYV